MTADQFPIDGGLLSIPWLLVAPPILVVAAWLISHRHNLRAALSRSWSGKSLLVFLLLTQGYAWFLMYGAANYEPIRRGAVAAPGPGVQSRSGGVLSTPYGSGPWEGVPLYRVAVNPGEEFQVLTSIRNNGPLPITLLGPMNFDVSAAMADPEDDSFISAVWIAPNATNSVFPSDMDLIPFRPVALGSGEEVALVLTFTGGLCADPNGQFKPPWNPSQLTYTTARGFSFVYEVAFWRKVGILWPQFDLDVGHCPQSWLSGGRR